MAQVRISPLSARRTDIDRVSRAFVDADQLQPRKYLTAQREQNSQAKDALPCEALVAPSANEGAIPAEMRSLCEHGQAL